MSLVDPDNPRPVDFPRGRALLEALQKKLQVSRDLVPLAQELLEQSCDGRIKMYPTYRTLYFRRSHPDLLTNGFRVPLQAVWSKK